MGGQYRPCLPLCLVSSLTWVSRLWGYFNCLVMETCLCSEGSMIAGSSCRVFRAVQSGARKQTSERVGDGAELNGGVRIHGMGGGGEPCDLEPSSGSGQSCVGPSTSTPGVPARLPHALLSLRPEGRLGWAHEMLLSSRGSVGLLREPQRQIACCCQDFCVHALSRSSQPEPGFV